MVYTSILLALAGLAAVQSSRELPQRARGGLAFKKEQSTLHLTSGSNSSVPHYIDAKCDNFDAANTCTFKQKYYTDEQYWDGKGPVFLYIGGEGDLSPPSGYITTLAQKYHVCILLILLFPINIFLFSTYIGFGCSFRAQILW